MASEGLPVQVACRVLNVSESGYYEWRRRPRSERDVRHAWLTDLIRQIHVTSRGIYGSRRVHAELTLGHKVPVSHGSVELLMRRAGIVGIGGRRRWKYTPPDTISADLVKREFARPGPNQLWVTDITEHRTREGKVYCAAVLDTYSRRIVGWSIDSSPSAALVTNALGMAIDSREGAGPEAGTVIHSDHGVQGGFNRSSQHLDHGGGRWDEPRSRERSLLRVGGGSGQRIGRCAHRCAHRAGPSPHVRCNATSGGASPRA
jgi:putative transposase